MNGSVQFLYRGAAAGIDDIIHHRPTYDDLSNGYRVGAGFCERGVEVIIEDKEKILAGGQPDIIELAQSRRSTRPGRRGCCLFGYVVANQKRGYYLDMSHYILFNERSSMNFFELQRQNKRY